VFVIHNRPVLQLSSARSGRICPPVRTTTVTEISGLYHFAPQIKRRWILALNDLPQGKEGEISPWAKQGTPATRNRWCAPEPHRHFMKRGRSLLHTGLHTTTISTRAAREPGGGRGDPRVKGRKTTGGYRARDRGEGLTTKELRNGRHKGRKITKMGAPFWYFNSPLFWLGLSAQT